MRTSLRNQIIEALKKKPMTARALAELLEVSKQAVHPVLKKIKTKKSFVRESADGPVSVRHSL